MELIESIVWIMTGFVSTLVTMEMAWRLAKGQAKRASVNTPIVMEKEVRAPRTMTRPAIVLQSRGRINTISDPSLFSYLN